MPTAPHSQPLIKGALIAYNAPVIGAVPNVIPFQFNPNELSRSLEQRGFQGGGQNRSETVEARRRVKGPPSESIDLTLRLDSSSLDRSILNADAAAFGIQPALSALEMLLYPKGGVESSAGRRIPAPGKVQISYAEKKVPLLLFVWGTRTLPVQLTSFSITEQAFDQRLNPVRAEVAVGLQVLTPDQLSDGIGKDAYMATHAQRKRWTQLNLVGAARNIGEAAGL